MHHLRSLLMLLVILAAAGPLAAQTSRAGKTYRITSHAGTAAAAAALKIAEATVKPAQKVFGRQRKKRNELLELQVFPNTVGFEKAVSQLPGDANASGLVSFASMKNATAYVTVHPTTSESALDKIILTGPTRRRIAHESVRIYCYGNLANHRTLPVWLIEGAAAMIAHDSLAQDGHALADICDDPFTSSQIAVVQGLMTAGKLPAVGSILRGAVSELSPQEQDAIHAVLFRYLLTEKHKSRFGRILKKACKIKSSPDLTRKISRYAGTVLKMGQVETEFRAWLSAQEPLWDEVVPSLARHKKGWVSAAFPNLNAVAWRRMPVGRKKWSLSVDFTILDGPAKQLNLLLGQTANGFASLAIEADFGVTLFAFNAKTSAWSELAAKQLEGIRTGRILALKVEVDASKLALSLDGETVLEATVPDTDLSGSWGLGAQAGSTGLWQNLSVK